MKGDKPDKKSGRKGRRDKKGNASAPSSADTPVSQTDTAAPGIVETSDAEETQQIADNDTNRYREQVMRLETWQHHFTAALVFAAFASIFTAVWQGCEMKWQRDDMTRQVELANSTLKLMQINLQPSLAITDPKIELPKAAGEDIFITCGVENLGGSDARVILIRTIGWPGLYLPKYPIGIAKSAAQESTGITEQCMITVANGRKEDLGRLKVEPLTATQLGRIESEFDKFFVVIQIAYEAAVGDSCSLINIYKAKLGSPDLRLVSSFTLDKNDDSEIAELYDPAPFLTPTTKTFKATFKLE